MTFLVPLVFEGKDKLTLNMLRIACREVFFPQQEGQITVSVRVNNPRLAVVRH